MGKIIILEGPDGGGKTTLARQLVLKGYRYFHDGVPPVGRDLLAHYLQVLDEAINSSYNTVFDRLWLGERIYGPIARGGDRIGDEGQRLFMRIHNAKAIWTVICLPPPRESKKNYRVKMKDEKDYLKSEDLWSETVGAYIDFYEENESKLTYHYDYTGADNPNSLLDMVNEPYSTLPTGVIGEPFARYLFIGDTPNHKWIDIPFHSFSGSSSYLNQALTLAGIKEKDLALTNANTPLGGIREARKILDSLPSLEAVFLMGNKAREWFDTYTNGKYPEKVYSMPHPSYLKRFRGANPQIMADMIKGFLNG